MEESALPYLLIEPGNRNTTSEISTVILLHGSEGNNETLLPFTSFLNDFRLLLPQAPLKVKGGFNWFNYDFTENKLHVDKKSLRSNLEVVRLFVKEIRDKYPDDNIYIGGLSLGAIFGNELFLEYPDYFSGLICMSGFLLDRDHYPFLHNKNVFVVHGENDQVISMDKFNDTVKVFMEKGAQVEFKIYDMGHGVCEDELHDIAQWVREMQE